MKEYERLMAEGLFAADFFEEEQICGFTVTRALKKIWAIEIDLLQQIDRVCKKHGLRYYLMFGSLLGAVRHHGFIPWDDDMDIVMPREDYERFIRLGHEFNEPYFLQVPCEDHDYFYSFSRLRNSRTTCSPEVFKYANFNHGIYVDVFPLDKWDLNNGKTYHDKIKELNIENSTYMRMGNPELSENDRERVRHYSGANPVDTMREINQYAQMYFGEQTNYVATIVLSIYSYEKNVFDIDDFSSSIPFAFCGFSFPVPIGYDRILTRIYNHYDQLPPMEKRGIWHEGCLFDPDTPYMCRCSK